MFAAGVKPHELEQLKAATGLTEGALPVRYLGIPLCTKKLSLAHCAPLIQSIKSKLHSWTVRSLSFAGRLQLLSTVIAGIINFWSCAYILPKGCLAEIDSLSSKFLWKGKTDGQGAAKVSWDSVTKPKTEGGLGLRNLLAWNTAAALKLIWLLFFKHDSIWSTWFRNEVLQGDINNFWVINTKQKHSWMANQLILLRTTAYPWIKVDVGNGETTYFWTSNWAPMGSIRTFLQGHSSFALGVPTNSTLAELWDLDHWILPAARSEEHLAIFTHLTSLALTNAADQYTWCPDGSSSQLFSTKLVYNLLRTQSETVPWSKEVWFQGGIPKPKFLTWLMVLNRCATKDRMLNWGLQVDGLCVLCHGHIESRNHLYYQCSYSWNIWEPTAARCGFTPSQSWDTTLLDLRSAPGTRLQRKLRLLCWQATNYLLWVERNNRIHRNQFKTYDILLRELDRLIRNRIATYRFTDPAASSDLLALWFLRS